MASVVINTRFNNRKAEADLKELQAKAKETAREINAVEKGLGSATTKRNKLRDDLEAARQKAAETVAALDEVNARLDAGRKSKFGVTSKGDETLSDKLAAKLQQQDTAVQAAADAYHAQDAAVQALQQRHAELTAQLAQEKDEATRQAEAVTNAAQAAQAAQVDVSNVQRAANAMDAFVSKLFNAASVSKILKRSLSAIGSIGGKAFDFVKSKAQSVQERLAQAAQSTEHFRKRLAGLVSGALVFNVLSSGLRTLTNWMGTALLSSSGLRTALGNLQGAAATAAAPIIQILTPALTALANAAAMVFSYIARLVAFFTGRTISASAGAAKAMNGVGSAAGSAAKKVKNANGELAAFDELNVLNKQSDDSSGGGGGGADSITSVVRGAVNGIIRIINGMISAIVGGMNAVIGLLNGFSFDVPEFAQDALGTAKVGFNIDPITAPQIPYLAQGAVIPANHEFLAVLGDQTNGTNVEAPLETIQQALAEVLAEWGGQDITIRFAASGGLEQLVRLLMPYIDKEKVRRGARLVVGGN